MGDTNLDALVELDFSDKEFYSTDVSESEHKNEPPEEVDHPVPTSTESDRILIATATRISLRNPFVYSCPVCSKELRSMSGFRGHVMKQHPNFSRIGFKGMH